MLPSSATASGFSVKGYSGYEITLVTLRKVRLRGLANSTTTIPLTLRLFALTEWNYPPDLPPWLVPEPRSAPLLFAASGVLAAVAISQRRRRT